jgi:hypothetical protein
MVQVFAVTVRHGAIDTNNSSNTFSAALIEAASHPERNTKMLRFMLGEMIECVLYPELLDREVYGHLLEWFDDWNPVKPAQIEVNTIYKEDMSPPTIAVYALFPLPVLEEIQCKDWSDLQSSHPSIAAAFRFYWAFPWSSKLEGEFDERNPDDPRLYPLTADQINFMPITC